MSLFGVYYEFGVTRENIEFLVDELGITQKKAPAVKDVAGNLLSLLECEGNTYAKVEINDKPGLMLRFSRRLWAEELSHPIEGIHAFIHPSC